MDEDILFALMVDLHREGYRQGPGSDEETLRAIELTRLDRSAPLQIADIGCGTGASTNVLASAFEKSEIAAIDLFDEFLDVIRERAAAHQYSATVHAKQASMETLPFAGDSLDLIWSEGAIYNIGFQNGLETWRPFLKPGGVLAASEITWLRPDPPEELRSYWDAEYPEIGTGPEKIRILENAGYDLIGYFTLPPDSWVANYYEPLAARIPAFLARHADDDNAAEVAEMQRHEADLYQRNQDWFSYGFYVARKRS